MTTVTETIDIAAPAESVFAHVDDIHNVGWHMTEHSSMAMMGASSAKEAARRRLGFSRRHHLTFP